VPEGWTHDEYVMRGQIGANTVHARGKTNTGPAREALEQTFLDAVDRDRVLPEEERNRRAAYAKKAHYARLGLASARARRLAAERDSAETSTAELNRDRQADHA